MGEEKKKINCIKDYPKDMCESIKRMKETHLNYVKIIDSCKNVVTNTDYSYVQIEFTAYDSEGNTIGTCLDNNSGLEKGGRWKFSAMCLENADNIARVELKELTGY